MARPISKKQLADFWYDNFMVNGLCCLCGNYGVVDTRGHVTSPAGVAAGAKVFCLCPNGRAMLRASQRAS